MNFKKLLVCVGLVGVSAVGVGCGGGDPPVTPPVVCNEMTLASGASHFYVVNLLSIAAPVGDVMPLMSAGFNVDGDEVAACNMHIVGESTEFTGQAPDNGTGIDNALGGQLASLANDGIQGSVDDGSVLLLVEVRGVDNMTNDSCVGVNFYLGVLPTGVAMPMVDGEGHLAADQTFDLSDQSFIDGLTGTMPRIKFGSAKIVAGRVQAGPSDFPLQLNLLGAELSLTIRDAQLRFNISETGISAGVLGGALNTQEVIDTVNGIPSLMMYAEIVADVLTMSADIDESMPPSLDSCEAGSISLQLDGVHATRGMVVTPPP